MRGTPPRGRAAPLTRRPNADAGKYLRATASYADGEGAGKTARGAAANPVAAPATNNEPQFAAENAARSVPENSTAGESVGNPVTASDGDDDALTYALTGSDDFTVNKSGQIMVATGQPWTTRPRRATP